MAIGVRCDAHASLVYLFESMMPSSFARIALSANTLGWDDGPESEMDPLDGLFESMPAGSKYERLVRDALNACVRSTQSMGQFGTLKEAAERLRAIVDARGSFSGDECATVQRVPWSIHQLTDEQADRVAVGVTEHACGAASTGVTPAKGNGNVAVRMPDGTLKSLEEYEQLNGPGASKKLERETIVTPDGTMSKADAWEHAARAAKEAHNLYKQPPRPKPKSKPAPNGWNKHTANAVSTELRVNDAELSSYIESAVDLVDNLEARNLEREADGMLFQCQLALKALAQAYAKYENKCSTPSWESLLAARSRGYAQLKRIEGFIAKRDKDKAEAIALNEKKLEASKVHLALVQEFQRRREIADGLAKEPKNDYVAAARVYGNAAKELDAFPYDVELFEPKDRDKFFELRKMAWARVAELEKFAKATKKLAAAQKRVAKKAAQLEVAVSAPPPTIPEEEEYVPPLPLARVAAAAADRRRANWPPPSPTR